MGWVGVATLIATACYVLYRFPPRTWAPEPDSPPPPPPPPAESVSEKRPPPENDMKRTTDDKAKLSAGIPEIKSDEENAEEAQTTPKASAATAPVLEVPVLDLDNNNNQTPIQNGSAKSSPSSHTNISPPPRPATDDKVSTNESSMMPPPPLPLSQPTPSAPANSSSSLMPPPPLPRLRATGQQTQQSQFLSPGPAPGRYPPRPSTSNSLAPPPSAAASQRGPPSRLSPTGGLAPPTQPSLKPSKNAPPSRRAALEPGFSPLDWAAKTSNPKENLRGANLPPTLIRVTPSMLKAQNGRKDRDAWTSYQGKVFNISPYVPFHPGGKGELLRGAGKDSGKLFLEVHPWVNWDAILGECLVGILVSENEAEGENKLDAMD